MKKLELTKAIITLVVIILSIALGGLVFYEIGINGINNIPELDNDIKLALLGFYVISFVGISIMLLSTAIGSIKDVYNQLDK